MTISKHALSKIRLHGDSAVVPFSGKPRYSSTAMPLGHSSFLTLAKLAEMAAFSLRGKKWRTE